MKGLKGHSCGHDARSGPSEVYGPSYMCTSLLLAFACSGLEVFFLFYSRKKITDCFDCFYHSERRKAVV